MFEEAAKETGIEKSSVAISFKNHNGIQEHNLICKRNDDGNS